MLKDKKKNESGNRKATEDSNISDSEEMVFISFYFFTKFII